MRIIKLCAAALNETDKQKRQAILREVFTGYNGSSDFPGMGFVDDLMEMYPNMKIVLNKRESASAWEKSVNGSLHFFSTWKYGLITWLSPQSYWHWQMYRRYTALAKRRFGQDTDIWSAKYYEMHNEWVRELCRKHNRELLEWEPDVGWEPLCEFLEKKVPEADFPKTNEGAEIRKGVKLLAIRGLVYWTGAALAAGAAVWMYQTYTV